MIQVTRRNLGILLTNSVGEECVPQAIISHLFKHIEHMTNATQGNYILVVTAFLEGLVYFYRPYQSARPGISPYLVQVFGYLYSTRIYILYLAGL